MVLFQLDQVAPYAIKTAVYTVAQIVDPLAHTVNFLGELIEPAIGSFKLVNGLIKSVNGLVKSGIGLIESGNGLVKSVYGLVKSGIGLVKSGVGLVELGVSLVDPGVGSVQLVSDRHKSLLQFNC